MSLSANKVTKEILKEGYSIVDLYKKEEVSKLLNIALNDDTDVRKIGRNFNHPIYKLAVPEKVRNFLFEIAKQKCNYLPNLTSNKSLINEKNISISFAKKGPSFGNAEMSKMAFHYDDSFVNLVLPLQLPPSGSNASGLLSYVNLKKILGKNLFSRAISFILGRNKIIRYIFKPKFLKYQCGMASIFFGDLTLHGVGSSFDGDRVSLTINLSQVSYERFYKRFYKTHKYLKK